MGILTNRIEREKAIVLSMIQLYCKENHATQKGLCDSCSELWEYVKQRLLRCPFKNEKPVCKSCAVHCYSPAKREQIRNIMRWSGPRLLLYRPHYALLHILDNLLHKIPAR